MAERPGYPTLKQGQDIYFSKMSEPTLEFIQPPNPLVTGPVFSGIKRPQREASHSHVSIAEVVKL